ncbi:MAG: DUF3306 domain-containing protein [Xanthobacteraceae bacterium]
MAENFVSRWARLKRNSDARCSTEPTGDGPPVDAIASSETDAMPGRENGDITDEPFDPASLPSIETITVNTDIRGFLQSRVPVELTRAALRRAWASDPAIRDFIGIAENQWDFNDPHAMPGFGPLQESDNLPALLARSLGSRDSLAGVIPEMPVSVEQSLPADREVVALDRTTQQAFAGTPPADNIGGSADTGCGEGEARRDGVTEGIESPGRHRPHGSALPR